jgi:hypothetical protein
MRCASARGRSAYAGKRVPTVQQQGDPLRVTSLNPVRDAKSIGHDVGMSRIAMDAKNTALRHRFVRLQADGESVAIAEGQREARVAQLLNELKWTYDGIVDDIVTLEKAKDGVERRDQILRETLEELATMAELQTGKAFVTATWRETLDALDSHVEAMITGAVIDAIALADIDLALERIEHIEKTAGEALRSYLGYISA